MNTAIIEKLKKILILANDKGAQPGEIEAAFGKAKEIAMRHGIDIAGIDISGKDEGKDGADTMTIERVDVATRSKNPQKYHRFICALLQEVFGVSVIRLWDCYVFIGEATDVAICRALFPWLEDVFYSTYYKAKLAGIVISCAADKNGIYSGLYNGMLSANRKAEAALNTEDRSKWAMVVRSKESLVKAKVEEEFPTLQQARRSRLSTNSRAWDHGYREGQKIRLNQVGTSGTGSRQLS